VKFFEYDQSGRRGIGVALADGTWAGRHEDDPAYPGSLMSLISGGAAVRRQAFATLAKGVPVDLGAVTVLPPLSSPGKILCVGLNYRAHAFESNVAPPDHPTIFARFASSLIGHGAAIVRPRISAHLDYEGELAVVIGSRGRHIPRSRALEHVAGYSVFNDVSVRDIQLRTSQWTLGKNFDGTGAFGPAFVCAEGLPQGAAGLRLVTRLNGAVMQDGRTDDMIFDVATLVAELSACMTLMPGDVIITGTPSGVGQSRKPPVFMKAGDVCEVEIEGIGTLRNVVVDEAD
jgi:acylpyruvate hydrolase